MTITVDGEPEGGRFGMDGSGSPGVARPVPTVEGRLYVQQDANWNTTALTDASGAVQQRVVYDPYGAATYLTPSWSNGSNDFTFSDLQQGGRQDTVTGLVTHRERDDNVTTGRWQQADPAGYIDGANRYQALKGAPTQYADPYGLAVGVQGWMTKTQFDRTDVLWTPEVRQAIEQLADLLANAFGGAADEWRVRLQNAYEDVYVESLEAARAALTGPYTNSITPGFKPGIGGVPG